MTQKVLPPAPLVQAAALIAAAREAPLRAQVVEGVAITELIANGNQQAVKGV